MDIIVEGVVVEESRMVILEVGVMVQILATDLHVITMVKLVTLNALVESFMRNHYCDDPILGDLATKENRRGNRQKY